MPTGIEKGKAKASAAPHRIIARSGPGPFITTLVLQDHQGRRSVWHSRRNRKGLDPEPERKVAQTPPRRAFALELSKVTWWIAALFMLGSALFAVGSGSALIGRQTGGAIFFLGSLFFTSAAYLQLFEVINEPDALTGTRPRTALWRSEPRKIGWWATVVQLVGTLLFNVNTFEAMRSSSPIAEEELVWAPDALGSLCFLVASYLAYAEVCRSWAAWQPRNVSWWVAVINLVGSVAFGASAVASLVLLPSGDLLNARAADSWTFVGAICFLAGAYLLLPEMTAHSRAHGKEIASNV